MINNTTTPKETNAAKQETGEGCSEATCSPSSEVDTAPEQWRSQCLVARIQRDEALKAAEHAKAYKRVMKLENQKMKRQLAAAMDVISAIEERYIDGCDTYKDWKFMGDAARAFLSENAIGEARADTASSPHDKTL